MRTLSYFGGLLTAVAAAISLSACSMFPVGPDLAKAPSPFGDATRIQVVDDQGDTVADITHQPTGDTGVLHFGDFDSKTYNADVTWHAFDPGLKDQQDYWLAGVNLFKTADRSAYAVLRFPHSSGMSLPAKADMIVINCGMRIDPDEMSDAMTSDSMTSDMAEDSSSSSDSSSASPEDSSAGEIQAKAMAEQLTGCDFDTLDQVYTFLPDMLAKANQEVIDNKDKGEDEKTNDYEWEKVTIKVP